MDDDHRRPPNVPEQAVFVGGCDGGVFLVLNRAHTGDGLYRASVFSDQSGKILFDGWLELMPLDSLPVEPADVSQFVGWSGSTLYLIDGRKLVAALGHLSPDQPRPIS
jgi:hypothetical protein